MIILCILYIYIYILCQLSDFEEGSGVIRWIMQKRAKYRNRQKQEKYIYKLVFIPLKYILFFQKSQEKHWMTQKKNVAIFYLIMTEMMIWQSDKKKYRATNSHYKYRATSHCGQQLLNWLNIDLKCLCTEIKKKKNNKRNICTKHYTFLYTFISNTLTQ